MQKQELNFIIKAKLPQDKHYKSLMKFPTGLRQKYYTAQYKKAQDTIKVLEQSGMMCKLVCKYLKTYVPNVSTQLHLV